MKITKGVERRSDQAAWEKKEVDLIQGKSDLSATLEETKADLEEARNVIAKSFGDGFAAVVEQAKTLFPDVDFSGLDPMKEVVDGQIVDFPDVDS